MMGHEFNVYKKMIDEHILYCLPDIDQKCLTLYDSMRYSLTAGGKRIRPVLMMACNKLAGGSDEFALPFACAAEFIQTYSLIHDDLPCMDDDDYRRGQLTNHKVYGEAMALLAGDGLLSSAYEVMLKDMLLYLDNDELLRRKTRAAFEISKGTGVRGMVAGQVGDIEAENKSCSPEMLDFIHINKTAAFIKSVCVAGAYLGGCSKELKNDIAVYGENLGLAFQIVDDILDVIGDAKEMGKATGVDSALNKATYPAIHGLEQSKARAMKLLTKARVSVEKYYDEAEVLNDIIDYLESQIV